MNHISVKSTYGLAAILDIALYAQDKPLQSKVIAEQRRIPAKYLESILCDLKNAGLVISQRGSQGGYFLAKEAHAITVKDIVTALDGPLQLAGHDSDCGVLKKFWVSVESSLESSFSYKLSDLVLDHKKQQALLVYNI